MPIYSTLRSLTRLFSYRFISRLINSLPDKVNHKKMIHSVKSRRIALYVHIPYCLEPVCRFCCFVRYPLRSDSDLISYARALVNEIDWYSSNLENASVGSIYFGGGTPTVNISLLGELIDVLRSYFGMVPITVESNPRTLINGGLDQLKLLKINRLSIGIQSFQDWKLKRMGRYSLPIEENKKIIREALGKFDTVNIDLVWGIPGENERSVIYDVVTAFNLGVDQATFYPIMPPPMKSKVMPDYVSLPISRELKLYRTLLSTVLSYDYRPDTPWCMSKMSNSQQLIDEYITEYYDFIGIGVSSIGKIRDYVYVDTFSPEKYVKMIKKRGYSVSRSMKLNKIDSDLFDIDSSLFGLNIRKPISIKSFTSFLLWSLAQLMFFSLSRLINVRENANILYALHLVQKTLYSGMNALREIGIKHKI